MSAYSKDFKEGVVRIDPSLLNFEPPSVSKSSGILRELEGLCYAMREMEIAVGKEKNRNVKLQSSLKEAHQRIAELNGIIENLKSEILGQRAKEESFLEQIRTQSQKASALKAELEA